LWATKLNLRNLFLETDIVNITLRQIAMNQTHYSMSRDDGENLRKTLKKIQQKIKDMTNEEFRESLRRAGIIDKHGKLTKHYRRK
jgi:hypothetical protein